MNSKTTQLCLSLFLCCFSFLAMNGQNTSIDDADPEFTSPFADFSGIVKCISVQPDSKIIAAGIVGLNNSYGVVRLNENGSVDESFLTSMMGTIYAVELLPNGKIVIGGVFKIGSINNQKYCLARLNSDGSLDETFIPVETVNNSPDAITSIAIQNDGKIVVGGYFNQLNGVPTPGLARINVDGSLDSTLNLTGAPENMGFNGHINSIAILGNGKILVAGAFSYMDVHFIMRLNADGSFDSTFNANTNDSISTIYVKSDGKILIGGWFTTLNSLPISYIGCLNSDGTTDTTFNPGGTGALGDVETIAIDSAGKIIIGGGIISYNGETRNSIARLNDDGTLDDNFNHDIENDPFYNGFNGGIDSSVHTIKIQQNDKILAGGGFGKYKNIDTPLIARIMSGEVLGTDALIRNKISVFPNPATDILTINNPSGITIDNIAVYDITGKIVLKREASLNINVQQLPQGVYLLKITTQNSTSNYKFVKQ